MYRFIKMDFKRSMRSVNQLHSKNPIDLSHKFHCIASRRPQLGLA